MKKYFKRIFVAWSIFWNTIFGGRNNQTISARMWQRKRNGKWHIVPIIDKLFWWEKDHCQDIPQSFEALERLPAVGHKTASVVMSQAFGVPAFPVDTHIHRLMYRWGLSNGKNVTQTEKDAKRLFPEDKWNDLHLQIIWYGREYCPARGWKIENDSITQKIGRRSVINKLQG